MEKRAAGFLGGAGATIGPLTANLRGFLRQQVAPLRLASHLAVLIVAVTVLLVSQMEQPDVPFPLHAVPEDGLLQSASPDAIRSSPSNLFDAVGGVVGDAFRRLFSFNPSTEQPVAEDEPAAVEAPLPRDEIVIYTVRRWDNLTKIAYKFDLNPVTIIWANTDNKRFVSNPDLIFPGEELTILPIDGVLHEVVEGETLSSIAMEYQATVSEIVDYPLNDLESKDDLLTTDRPLIIPNGSKTTLFTPEDAGRLGLASASGAGNYDWPVLGTSYINITQSHWAGHKAIDIGAKMGTWIVAAASGVVIDARTGGWNSGYGKMVTINHGNGFFTHYAHMSSISVSLGDNVDRGQPLGKVGSTGHSTGPHLHFEIRKHRAALNPLHYYKR